MNDLRQVKESFRIAMTEKIDKGEDFDAESFNNVQGLDVWRAAGQYAYDAYKDAADEVEAMYKVSAHKMTDPIHGDNHDKQRLDEREENKELLAFLRQGEDKTWLENQNRPKMREIINCAMKAKKLYEAEEDMLRARLEHATSKSETK